MRADEWWEYKLVPILSAFYATALVLRLPVISIWISALSLLLSMVTVAVYASAINELTDRADDAAAGKRNRATDQPRFIVWLFAVAVGVGFTFGWLWREDTRLFSCYLATWLAFAFYSIPPFRLKKRGLPGVLCVAAGEQMFPALVAVFVACRGTHRMVSAAWVTSVAIWALAYGLRGIIWHQMTDVENDRRAGVQTFAARHPRGAVVFGTFVVFPIELAALTAMLWQIGSPWPPAFLVLYTLNAIRNARRWHMAPVIVAPKPQFFIVLHQFYSDLFPVALLISAAIRDRLDLIVLAIHLLLFPRRASYGLYVVKRIGLMLRSSISRRRVSASTANTVVNASEPHHGGFG